MAEGKCGGQRTTARARSLLPSRGGVGGGVPGD